MTLEAEVGLRLGSLTLDVSLLVEPGEVVAILGPNASGKTTLLRALAGLAPIDRGRITLDGRPLDDPERDLLVAPERRPIGVVFQDYLLFANLTALDNVAFGLRARGMGKSDARARAAAWLEQVGLTDHAMHRPGALSGGQQQRVALARALAAEPRLLLLDEPLAALDAGTRSEVRRDLRRHLSSFEGIRLLVTHDPLDAHALADRVVVIEQGRIVQDGTLADVTAHPRSRYVAELAGTNLLTGNCRDGTFTVANGATLTVADTTSGPVYAAIHPHAVALYLSRPDGSPRNVWLTRVVDIDEHLDRVRVRLDGPLPLVGEITPATLGALGLHVGGSVWASVKATEIVTYPA